jgi:hypothetical protein
MCSSFMCIGYTGAKICSMGREHNSKSEIDFEELNHRCMRSVEDSGPRIDCCYCIAYSGRDQCSVVLTS